MIIAERPLCFTVSGNVDRLDCLFNNPNLVEFEKNLWKKDNVVALNVPCTVTDGNHEETRYTDTGVPLLTMSNVNEDGIDLTDVKFISETQHNGELKRSKLGAGNVIFTKLGSFNYAHVIPRGFGEANTSAELAIIRIREEYTGKVIPEYLALYLNSEYAKKQTDKSITGLSRDRTVLGELRKIGIILPEFDIQKAIVENTNKKMHDALTALGKYRDTLARINSYFDEQINLNSMKNPLKKSYTMAGNIINDRMDCFSNSPNYRELVEEINSYTGSDFEFIEGKTLSINEPLGKDFVEANSIHIFKYLDIGNTEKELGNMSNLEEDNLINLPTRARQRANSWDVLLPRPIGSSEGVVILGDDIDHLLYSTGFIGIHNKTEENALVLWASLKSKTVQNQLTYLQSGSLQPEITKEDFKKLVKVPIPKDDNASRVALDIKNLRQEAEDSYSDYIRLKTEAKRFFTENVE